MATVYELPTGRDPLWDAARAKTAWEEEQLRRDIAMRQAKARESYTRSARDLALSGGRARQGLAGTAETRGLLSSGLYNTALARQRQDETTGLGRIAHQRDEQVGGAGAD